VPEKLWTLGYLDQNLVIYESNKVFLIFEKYIGFYICNFYSPFSLAAREKGDPYFRENEPSEATEGTKVRIA
jgi:hypothetical protein